MKTVIITGANGNLGSAVTNEFLDKGYHVIATIRTENDKAGFPVHENLSVEIIDLNDGIATSSFIQKSIDKFATIDAALMLVGGFAMGGISKTTVPDIKKQIALNFETAYHVAQPLFDHMMGNGNGRLVFIGSRPAIDPSYGKKMVAYALSKSMLFTLAEHINAEAKGKNVTATVVAPSTLDTPLNRQSMPDVDPETWVKPSVLAEILEFIVSDKAHPLRETVLKVYNNS